jgi:hypothetical protein
MVNHVSARLLASNYTEGAMAAFVFGSGIVVVAGLTSVLALSTAMVVHRIRGVH